MLSLADRILNLSLQHAIGLAGYENYLVGKILGILDANDADLERQILVSLEETEGMHRIARLKAIRKDLEAVNNEAYAALGAYLPPELTALAGKEVSWAVQAVRGALPFKLSWTRPSRQLLKKVVTEDPFQGALLKKHVERIGANRANAIMDDVRKGIVQQEAYSSIIRRIRGTSAADFADGTLELIGRRQAEALARTATAHVVESARDELWDENYEFISAIMWVATLDRRTTKFCQVRDGKTYTPKTHKPTIRNGRPTHNHAWGNGPGRLHWRCRSTSIPVFSSLAEFRRLGVDIDKLSDAERAAFEGPVSVEMDYGDWLRKQDVATQNRALGSVGRADKFRAGEDLDKVWSKRFVPEMVPQMSLSELFPDADDEE